MNELSPRTRALLEVYKCEVLPTAKRDAASWLAIEQRIAANEPPLLEELETRRRGGWPVVVVSLVAAVAAAAAVLWLVGGGISQSPLVGGDGVDAAAYGRADSAPRGDVEHSQATARQGASPPALEPPRATEPPRAIETLEPPIANPATLARPPHRRKASPLAEVDALGEEAASLATIRAALRDHRPHDALQQLARHAQRFSNGALVQERRVLEISARCAAGQRERARKDAARFLRTDPRSPLAARVRTICVE